MRRPTASSPRRMMLGRRTPRDSGSRRTASPTAPSRIEATSLCPCILISTPFFSKTLTRRSISQAPAVSIFSMWERSKASVWKPLRCSILRISASISATVVVVQMPEKAQPRTPPSSPTATRGWWSASLAALPLASRLPMVNMASCLA
ncbi:hypothetical protein X763_28705 [Mesorhizobium sp. LSHC432A00]|nr:hypothetical protein X763_28705 [Mesorhizobium sp. LSHC432A00]